MQKSDIIKLVIVVALVGVGGWFFLRPAVDTEDYVTVQETAEPTPAVETADRSSRGKKKKKPPPPMSRVNEDIG